MKIDCKISSVAIQDAFKKTNQCEKEWKSLIVE